MPYKRVVLAFTIAHPHALTRTDVPTKVPLKTTRATRLLRVRMLSWLGDTRDALLPLFFSVCMGRCGVEAVTQDEGMTQEIVRVPPKTETATTSTERRAPWLSTRTAANEANHPRGTPHTSARSRTSGPGESQRRKRGRNSDQPTAMEMCTPTHNGRAKMRRRSRADENQYMRACAQRRDGQGGMGDEGGGEERHEYLSAQAKGRRGCPRELLMRERRGKVSA